MFVTRLEIYKIRFVLMFQFIYSDIRVRGSHNSILKIEAEDLCAPALRHLVRVSYKT